MTEASVTLAALELAVAEFRFDDARSFSENLAFRESRNARFQALRGRVLLHLNDYKGAVSFLQSALSGGERGVDSWLWLAEAFEQLGKDSEALKVLARANHQHPKSALIASRMAGLLVAVGDSRSAIAYARIALGLNPTLGQTQLILAQALTEIGQGDEAKAPLEAALGDPTAEAMAAGMLGYWHQARGQSSEAKALFDRSIRVQPKQALAYYGWSQSTRVMGKDRDRLDAIRELANDPALPPEDAMNLHYVLGKGLADLGEYESSMEHFDVANEFAFKQNLGSRPFNRHRYAQIIDSTIATFTAEFFRANRRVGALSRKPIFVLGMMRSGTTLVEQILSSHPQVTAGGELSFWLDSVGRAFDVDKRTVDLKRLPRLEEEFARLIDSISPSSAHVTDKMPQNFQVLGLIHLAFPNSPIIHIRRHPVDTCFSIYTTPYQLSPDFAHSRESIVFAYRQYQRLMAHWRKVLPAEQFLEIDYEDLTANPERVTRKLVSFCKLEWNEVCLQPEKNERVVATPSLVAVRQPINRSAVDRWKVYEPWLGEFAKLLP